MEEQKSFLIGAAWVTREPFHYTSVDLVRLGEKLGKVVEFNEYDEGVRNSYAILIPVESGNEVEMFRKIKTMCKTMFYSGGKSFSITALDLKDWKVPDFAGDGFRGGDGYMFDGKNIFEYASENGYTKIPNSE